MVAADIVIALAYLINRQPGWAWYWVSAASISGAAFTLSE
jgi:hypothetical protein